MLRSLFRFCVLILVAVLVLSFAPSSFAGVGGRISGTIKDASGAVVPRAMVTITNPDTGVRQTLTTDEKGIFAFLDVAVGRYDLEVDSPGFKPYRRKGIVIDADSALLIDAALEAEERVLDEAEALLFEAIRAGEMRRRIRAAGLFLRATAAGRRRGFR